MRIGLLRALRLALPALSLALVLALVLAGGAAGAVASPEATGGTPAGSPQPPTEAPGPPVEQHSPEPPIEQHPPPPPAGEQPPAEPPPVEQHPPAPPAGEQPPAEPPPVEQHPPAPPVGEQHSPEAPPAEQHSPGQGSAGGAEEHAAGGMHRSETPLATQAGAQAPAEVGEAGGLEQVPAQTPPVNSGTPSLLERPSALMTAAAATKARRVKAAGRSLAASSASAVGKLISWLGAPPSDSQPPGGAGVAAPSISPDKAHPAGVRENAGTADERSPAGPTPAPEPGGSSGGSATGASGAAAPGLLALTALVLIAAPLAMRRLRLVCEPLLTSCFVLIPERPD